MADTISSGIPFLIQCGFAMTFHVHTIINVQQCLETVLWLIDRGT